MDELARHKIEVVSAPGEAIHIDWVNTTAATPDELVQQASKTYLDWYMLTQARSRRRCRAALADVSLRGRHAFPHHKCSTAQISAA